MEKDNIMTAPINTFKNLDDIFDVEATPVENMVPALVKEDNTSIVPITDAQSFPSVDDLLDDYQKSRNSLRNLLDKGEHVIENMLQIAVQTESARSFEVAGNLIKTMSEVAKDLVNLHEITNKAKSKTSVEDKKNVSNQQINNTQTNNIVFQGTTTDLFDMLENK